MSLTGFQRRRREEAAREAAMKKKEHKQASKKMDKPKSGLKGGEGNAGE